MNDYLINIDRQLQLHLSDNPKVVTPSLSLLEIIFSIAPHYLWGIDSDEGLYEANAAMMNFIIDEEGFQGLRILE